MFIYNGNNPAERLEEQERYRGDRSEWESVNKAEIIKWNRYEEHGQSIFLAIKGQVEPSLWDKTRDDPGFTDMDASKCPIALINLMNDRCTGAVPGVWAPLALMEQHKRTICSRQSYRTKIGNVLGSPLSIGDYKRAVESNVATTCRLARMFAFGVEWMLPILAAA